MIYTVYYTEVDAASSLTLTLKCFKSVTAVIRSTYIPKYISKASTLEVPILTFF